MSKLKISILGVAAALSIAGGIMLTSPAMAWNDSDGGRASYTLSQIDSGVLGNNIVFNSISNNPKIGDEKNFVQASKAGANTWYTDDITVEDGETYEIRLYVHNNSPLGADAVAKGVNVKFQFSQEAVSKSHQITGTIDTANAAPKQYYDHVNLVSDHAFVLEYVPGSARYDNANGSFALADSVINGSAAIGYNSMNGEIPGCFQYDGLVYIKVKAHYSVSSTLKQQVRLKGTKEWHDVISANIGDEVEYRIDYVNLSDHNVDNVLIRDTLPTNVEYVEGTTYLHTSFHPEGVKMESENLTVSGVNIGGYAPKGKAIIIFTAKIVDKTITACDGRPVQLVNWATSSVEGELLKDNTVVELPAQKCVEKKEEPTPEPTPDPEPTPEPTPEPKLPDTGASDITAAALGAGAMVTALGYYIASRKKLM